MSLIEGDNYKAEFVSETNVFSISGTLRLRGMNEYQAIADAMKGAGETNNCLIVDLKQLNFLNSSGIAMLSKFVINARKKDDFSLRFMGSKNIPWQSKSLANLQRLMPTLELTFN